MGEEVAPEEGSTFVLEGGVDRAACHSRAVAL